MKNHWRPVSSRLWQDQTIRSLSRDAQILYFYLLTCEANTGLGIFYAPIPLVAYETNVPLETISDLLSELSGLAVFDEDSATWFVPETGRQELTGLKPTDKRKIGIINELREWLNHRFYAAFREAHADLLVDSVHLPSPSEALEKPLPSRKRNSSTHSKANSDPKSQEHGAGGACESSFLQDLWNAKTSPPIPRCMEWNDGRKSHAKARLTEYPDPEQWAKAFEIIEATPFFRGENDLGWCANVDFVLKPGKLTKVFEGHYNPKKAVQPLGPRPVPPATDPEVNPEDCADSAAFSAAIGKTVLFGSVDEETGSQTRVCFRDGIRHSWRVFDNGTESYIGADRLPDDDEDEAV